MPAFTVTRLELPTVCIFRTTLNPWYCVNIYMCYIRTHNEICTSFCRKGSFHCFSSYIISYILEFFAWKHIIFMLHVQSIFNKFPEADNARWGLLVWNRISGNISLWKRHCKSVIARYIAYLCMYIIFIKINHYLSLLSNTFGYKVTVHVGNLMVEWYSKIVLY